MAYVRADSAANRRERPHGTGNRTRYRHRTDARCTTARVLGRRRPCLLVLDEDRVDEVRSELEESALDAIAEAVEAAEGAGVETTSDVDVGNPANCIVDYAADNDIDLVVMGTSGDEYEANVVGSVSKRVVDTSTVPVLTVGSDA